MSRKVVSILGVCILIALVASCSSNPEKGLLGRYFNALSLKDSTTLSTMAISPATFDFDSWEITNVSEETVTPFTLAEMDAKENELKKQQQDSVGITLNARDDLDEAIFERNNARSRTARAGAQKKVDEMQAAYDTQKEAHDQLQKDLNLATEQASKEEKISSFSLGGDYPGIRAFVGEVFSKEVDVNIKMKDGTNSNYRIFLKRYVLQDESANMSHRGRWIILKFERMS